MRLLFVRLVRGVLIVAALLIAQVVYGGAEMQFVCNHCGLKGTYVHGGLLSARQVVAFCPTDHFVHISSGDRKRLPKPVRLDGDVAVYVCPVCKKPVARRWDEKECPRCGSTSFKVNATKLMVD